MYKFKIDVFARVCLLLLLVCFCFPQAVFSQDESEQLDSVDYSKLSIPPLQVLFENAKNSPAVQLYQAKMEEQTSLLKTEKRSWMKYFKVGTSWQYGRIGSNSAFSDEYTPLFYQYSSAKQNNYYVSATLSVPLDDFFDRKNRIQRQIKATKSTQIEIDKWHDEQKLKIIEMYTKAIQALAVLKKKSEALAIINTQYEMTANDFKNGNAKISDLSSAKKQQIDMVESYEQTRSSLNSSLLELEVLSMTKIISK